MKRVFAILLTVAALIGCLSGCSVKSNQTVINVYNWGQYISEGDDGCIDVIAEFEKRYPDIKVNYVTFDSNETMYAKMANGGITVDVIIPSDYMVNRLISENMLLPLNKENIPNAQYIDQKYLGWDFDPDNTYSLPYSWGTVGIIYNSKYVDEADVAEGWDLLWNEKYADKILMFDNSRDAFCIAQCKLGYEDINHPTEQELLNCAQELAKQRPIVQQYIMDQVFDLMENEEAWIAPYYAGDYTVMVEQNEALEFYLPAEQGFNMFIDAMCIPTCCQQKEAAELFINFLCDPEISAANMDWVEYSVPSTAAKEFLDEETVNDPVSYPSDEFLVNGTSYAYLDPDVTRFVESLFMKVRIS